jgi:hypothetical protein
MFHLASSSGVNCSTSMYQQLRVDAHTIMIIVLFVDRNMNMMRLLVAQSMGNLEHHPYRIA